MAHLLGVSNVIVTAQVSEEKRRNLLTGGGVVFAIPSPLRSLWNALGRGINVWEADGLL